MTIQLGMVKEDLEVMGIILNMTQSCDGTSSPVSPGACAHSTASTAIQWISATRASAKHWCVWKSPESHAYVKNHLAGLFDVYDGHRGWKMAMLQESVHLLGQQTGFDPCPRRQCQSSIRVLGSFQGVAEELVGSMPGVEGVDLAVLLYSGPGTKRNYDKCLSGVATDLDTQCSVKWDSRFQTQPMRFSRT